ncbi:hypothetical protein P43SY_011980 [Pythium insidiosum]|uniref:Uncharacterized protein n=1 Tax=Pythium insidiosum TaxID=114742 RepID=A0AAD5LSE4_PYTIN|nr:hypothetical protein P43SY_011980 [Pythium insidiosum]
MTSTVRCRFERHPQCRHDDLFHRSYQRTNRTKGSKILRCFPHCCPQHVARSFCGASLLVRVDASGIVDSDDQDDDDDGATRLLVVARFRLRAAPRLAVGDRLLRSAIESSLQSEDEPNNVWISSRGVQCGPRRGDWRFELNESARWFYGWESGVAKAHRLQEHVLEIVVFTDEAPRRPHRPHTHPEAQTQQTLLIVRATLESPPFKLISFRRATPQAMHALSVASASPKSPLVADVLHSRTVYPPESKLKLKRWRDLSVDQPWRTSVMNVDVDEDVDAIRPPEDTSKDATSSLLLKRPRLAHAIESDSAAAPWLALDTELHALLHARLRGATLALLCGDRRALFETHFASLLTWISARTNACGSSLRTSRGATTAT